MGWGGWLDSSHVGLTSAMDSSRLRSAARAAGGPRGGAGRRLPPPRTRAQVDRQPHSRIGSSFPCSTLRNEESTREERLRRPDSAGRDYSYSSRVQVWPDTSSASEMEILQRVAHCPSSASGCCFARPTISCVPGPGVAAGRSGPRVGAEHVDGDVGDRSHCPDGEQAADAVAPCRGTALQSVRAGLGHGVVRAPRPGRVLDAACRARHRTPRHAAPRTVRECGTRSRAGRRGVSASRPGPRQRPRRTMPAMRRRCDGDADPQAHILPLLPRRHPDGVPAPHPDPGQVPQVPQAPQVRQVAVEETHRRRRPSRSTAALRWRWRQGSNFISGETEKRRLSLLFHSQRNMSGSSIPR